MKPFHSMSTVEQLAEYLREEIGCGGLEGKMPGVAQLVRRLGVGTKTVVAALEILKEEGFLIGHGERRPCRITPTSAGGKSGLLVRMLLYEREDAHDEHSMELQHQLEKRGHRLEFAAKTLTDLRFDVKRVSQLVEKSGADAWLIRAGSRDVLEWFATRPTPSFAMFGRQTGLPMASLATVKSSAMAQALRRLVDLGHHRIVMLVREERRKPTPGLFERRFLESLEQLGIKTSAFNLPDWQDDPADFHQCLDMLFRHTPPTAIFLAEPALYFSAQQHLLEKGIRVPRDVSLISLDPHPAFQWFHPEVSHIRTDTRRWVPRIVKWVDNVATGKDDRKETLITAEFVEGGTIGPTF